MELRRELAIRQGQVGDIDSQRIVIHIEQGKGRRDRDIPMTPIVLELLREYWRHTKSRVYMFPSRFVGNEPEKPISSKTVWNVVHEAAVRAGLTKRIGPHTLRHYLPFLTMSGDIGHQSRPSGESGHSADPVSVSPDIVFSFLQAVEETEQLISGSIAGRPAIWWCCLGESLLFHRQRCLQIDLRCFHRLMSEPQCDHGTIDACL